MARSLRWSRPAVADLRSVFEFILQDDPATAASVRGRIARSVERPIDFPNSGRRGRRPATRELVVTGLPYIVVYRSSADSVEILRVLPTSRRWPE